MKQIDARGLACPAPVLLTKKNIDQEKISAIQILTDNEASQQNVRRFLESQGYETTIDRIGNDFYVNGNLKTKTVQPIPLEKSHHTGAKKIMVMITTDRMGYGDDTLGIKLMINFIKTLKEMGKDLWQLIFVNNGVKLTIDGSDVLEDLKTLESNGIKILVCGTCLNHFQLLERKQVGETTNMLDIVTAMQLADTVINI